MPVFLGCNIQAHTEEQLAYLATDVKMQEELVVDLTRSLDSVETVQLNMEASNEQQFASVLRAVAMIAEQQKATANMVHTVAVCLVGLRARALLTLSLTACQIASLATRMDAFEATVSVPHPEIVDRLVALGNEVVRYRAVSRVCLYQRGFVSVVALC